MTKLFNSDDLSINSEFVRSNVTQCDDREFGADPYEIMAALEEQYGLPMATKNEPLPLPITGVHVGRITARRAKPMRVPRIFTAMAFVPSEPLMTKHEPVKIERISLEKIELDRIARLMAMPALTSNFTTDHVVHVPTDIKQLAMPIVVRSMTYDQAYEEASIACWEIMGSQHSSGKDWDNLHDKLLDGLCIKHNIKE